MANEEQKTIVSYVASYGGPIFFLVAFMIGSFFLIWYFGVEVILDANQVIVSQNNALGREVSGLKSEVSELRAQVSMLYDESLQCRREMGEIQSLLSIQGVVPESVRPQE